MAKFNSELAILSRVRHRNVVAFVGAVTEQPHLCVVMEYMEAGTLHTAIHKKGLTLTLPRLLEVRRHPSVRRRAGQSGVRARAAVGMDSTRTSHAEGIRASRLPTVSPAR